MVEKFEDGNHPAIVVTNGVNVQRARRFIDARLRENLLDE